MTFTLCTDNVESMLNISNTCLHTTLKTHIQIHTYTTQYTLAGRAKRDGRTDIFMREMPYGGGYGRRYVG